jgi:hypothetical protein
MPRAGGHLDKRRFGRAALSRFVVLTLDGQECSCTLLDLSGGGAAVKTHLRPAIGKAVNLQVPGLGFFQGEVVRHLDDGIAIEFKIEHLRQHDLNSRITEKRFDAAVDATPKDSE